MSSETRALRPAWAWTPEGLVRAPVIAVDGEGRIVPHAGEPVRDLPGLLMPGLVNAHTHLELGPVRFPAKVGLPGWVPFLRAGDPPSAVQAGAGTIAAIRAGTAGVGEISNTGLSAPVMASAHLAGRAFREHIGVDRPALPDVPTGERSVPHGTHTCHPDLVQACAAQPGPWSVHFDEDPDEARFLRGEGPWMDLMRRWGRDLSAFPFPHLSPARYLDALGVLSPRALLVHATCTRGDDLDVLAASGARVALCVRSNQALTGALPDVPGLLARGVPVAVGTDSLASAPDLDLFAEAVALRAAFPDVPLVTWAAALTSGGADALDLPLGRLRVGEAPGLLHVELEGAWPDDPDAVLDVLFDRTRRRRRWLSCPAP